MNEILKVVIDFVLPILNIVFSILVASFQMRMILFCKGRQPPWCWIRILMMLISMYWAAVYIFVLVQSPENYNPVLFGQVFVRPAFTLTLGIMAAMSIFRGKNG